MRVKELFTWMHERHQIYVKRQRGESKPWTKDPILQRYRFCNVYRELDTVTRWIRENWRERHTHDADVWFAMVVARLVNWPDSLQAVGYPVPWSPQQFVEAMDSRKLAKLKVFTGAYMIHADAHHKGSKAAYLAEMVLTPMWNDRVLLRPRFGDTLAAFHRRLTQYRDMGDFMAGQVVADTKYTDNLLHSADWHRWATPGPGSMRGLSRVIFSSPSHKWSQGEWYENLQQLHAAITPLQQHFTMPPLHAQDLQNCLCEFDKYERVRLGEGKPRSLYPGVLGMSVANGNKHVLVDCTTCNGEGEFVGINPRTFAATRAVCYMCHGRKKISVARKEIKHEEGESQTQPEKQSH